MPPLARKDRDTLIEQSTTLIEQSITLIEQSFYTNFFTYFSRASKM